MANQSQPKPSHHDFICKHIDRAVNVHTYKLKSVKEKERKPTTTTATAVMAKAKAQKNHVFFESDCCNKNCR